jgi:hypothetical protein
MNDNDHGRTQNAAGGVEGGMASGSAGGPGQSGKRKPDEDGETAVEEKVPSTNVEDKLGDFGKGSREQTQGGAEPGGRS